MYTRLYIQLVAFTRWQHHLRQRFMLFHQFSLLTCVKLGPAFDIQHSQFGHFASLAGLLHGAQIFVFLVGLCLLCTICAGIWENSYGAAFQQILAWEHFIPGSYVSDDVSDESSQTAGGATLIAVMTFFSYIIVLNTLVPISLYVRSETDPGPDGSNHGSGRVRSGHSG